MKKRKIKKNKNSSNIVIIFSILLIIVIILYTCLNSNMFNTKNIVIEGNEYVDDNYIKTVLEFKNTKNIFRYNIRNMEKSLLSNKYIESVNIKRLFPDTIKVSIIEKEIYAVLHNNNEYCYIDNKGNFIDKIDIEDKENDILVVDIDYDLNNLQEIKFKNDEEKKRLLYLLECIKEESIYKKIENIDMLQLNSIKMYTKDDIKILLNNDESLKYNISKLSIILSDLQNKKKQGGEIDLTIEKYALYKS